MFDTIRSSLTFAFFWLFLIVLIYFLELEGWKYS